jgi:hypothetical protein
MKTVYIIAGGAVVAALALVYFKGAASIGYSIGSGVVDMVDNVVAGTVETIGEKIGIPKTNMSECERLKAAGDTWGASFACPAKDFIQYVWS